MPDPGNEYPEQQTAPAESVPAETIATRSDLLPEEITAGSADPKAQAEAILRESEARIEDPNAGLWTVRGVPQPLDHR